MPVWDNNQSHAYDCYGQNNEFELVEGVVHLPIAQDVPTDPAILPTWTPTRAVQVHAPFRKRTVTWKAKKKGNPPVCPAPESVGAFSFTGGNIVFFTPQADSSFGRFDWTVGGVYHFVEQARSDVADGFVLGNPAFTLVTQGANAANYGGQPPSVGAISKAGNDAVYGYTQATQNDPSGIYWTYNTISYFPGTLFNASILNGATSIDSSDIGGGRFTGGNADLIGDFSDGGGGDF